jgi:hypothetical protein
MKKLILNNKTVALLAVALTVVSGAALAGAGGAQFAAISTEVSSWLNGAPGKIIAVLAFGAAMFNVVKQNFIAAIGAFLGAMLMANADSVIGSFMTAGI